MLNLLLQLDALLCGVCSDSSICWNGELLPSPFPLLSNLKALLSQQRAFLTFLQIPDQELAKFFCDESDGNYFSLKDTGSLLGLNSTYVG